MGDNQEFGRQQGRMGERIGDAPDRSVSFGPDASRVLVKPNRADELLQLMLIPRGPANRHSTALPLSPFWTPAHNLVTSRAHSLATAERAATRFWIASKAGP